MLKFGNKEFRNLEEQVYKNQQDIADLTAGISAAIGYMPTILGVYARFDEIPTGGYNTGDTFLIGSGTPYSVYVYTDKNQWVNVGQFPVAGPKGDKGDLGSVITAAAGGPQVTPESLNDFYIDTITGDWYVASRTVSGSLVYIKSFSLKGEKGDRGEQGLAGKTGPMGPTGPQGPLGERGLTGLKGDQGQKGDTGATGPAGNSVTNMYTTSSVQDPTDPTIFHNAIDVAYSDGTSTTFTIDTKGIKGDTGAVGPTGAIGPIGPTGPQGIQGPQGPAGNGVEDLISVRDNGAPVVTYDIQNGITINTTDQYTYGTDNKTFDVSTEKEIPIIAGKGISMDVNTTSDKVTIKVDDEQLATKSDLIDTALKLQPRLTAGEGINIDNNTNTISVTELDTGIKEINIGTLPAAGESITLPQATIDEIFAGTCTLVDSAGYKYIELYGNTAKKIFATISTTLVDRDKVESFNPSTGKPVMVKYQAINQFGCLEVTKKTLILKCLSKKTGDYFGSTHYNDTAYLKSSKPLPVTYSNSTINPNSYGSYAKINKTEPEDVRDYTPIISVEPIVTKQYVQDSFGNEKNLGWKGSVLPIISALGEFDKTSTSSLPKIDSILLGNTLLVTDKKLDKLYINFKKIYKLPTIDPVKNEILVDCEIPTNREIDKVYLFDTLPEGVVANKANYAQIETYNHASDTRGSIYYEFPKFEPTTEQQAALDSGITADKVTTYDGYLTSITEAKTQADKGVSDAAAAKAAADAALPTATFNEFETTNTAAIADAKKAGTDAQAELTTYKASNDQAIANLNTAIEGKQDILTAGNNITIENNTINAIIPEVDYPVTDVLVNGASVVTNKVANVDLSSYVKNDTAFQMIDVSNGTLTDEQKELLKTGKCGIIKDTSAWYYRLYPCIKVKSGLSTYDFAGFGDTNIIKDSETGSVEYTLTIHYAKNQLDNNFSSINEYRYNIGFNNSKSYTNKVIELKHIYVGDYKYLIPKVSYIDITISDNSAQGTITYSLLAILEEADYNCIRVNYNEIYRLSNKNNTENIWTYTQDSYNEGGITKYLNLSIITREFTITQNEHKKYYKHTMLLTHGGPKWYNVSLSDISSISAEYTLETIPDGVYPLMDEPMPTTGLTGLYQLNVTTTEGVKNITIRRHIVDGTSLKIASGDDAPSITGATLTDKVQEI